MLTLESDDLLKLFDNRTEPKHVIVEPASHPSRLRTAKQQSADCRIGKEEFSTTSSNRYLDIFHQAIRNR